MTESEIVQLQLSGFSDSQIRNLRKVARSNSFITSNNTGKPDVFTLPLPEEARFFFGIRRIPSAKIDLEINVKLNDELIIEEVNGALFKLNSNSNSIEEEYIETSRRLTGKDTLLYLINYGASVTESVTWFYAVDITLAPNVSSTPTK